MAKREVTTPRFFPQRPKFRTRSFFTPFVPLSKVRETIVGSNLTFGESNVDQNTYNVASFTPDPRSLLVLWVYNTNAASPNLPLSIVDSRGLGWTQIPGGTSISGNHRVTGYYVAIDAAVGAGTIAINLVVADASTGCIWAVDQYRNCVLGAGAFRNVQASSAGASLGQTLTLPAFEHANNLHVYAISHTANEVTTVGGGFTQRSDQTHANPAASFEVADKVNDTTADPSWATSIASRWVHFELVAA